MSLAYLALAPDGLTHTADWMYSVSWLNLLRFNPLVRLPEFLIGVALGRLFLIETADGYRKTLAHSINPGFLSGAALVGIVGVLSMTPHLPFPLLHNGLLDPLFALLIYTMAIGQGRLASVFSSSNMVLLGEASYGLYILHEPVANFFGLTLGATNPLPIVLAYLCVVVGISVLALHVLEKPGRRAIRRAYARHIARKTNAVMTRASERPA
jgi:peptidoglycan/LPS O-acetylase OafA/YrhL